MAKQLNHGFNRSLYWNSYKTKPAKAIEQWKNICKLLNASFQGVKKLYVLAYSIAENGNDEAGIKNNKTYFLPRGEIKNYNILIDGRNFYEQPIKWLNKTVSTGYGDGDDCTTGCLLDYAYFKDNYRQLQAKSNSTNSISRSCWRRK